MNKLVKNENIKLLLQNGRELYHTQDLMVLWGIDNPNTLYTMITRYAKRGILNNIYKGFYSIKPLKDINPLLLGMSAIHKYNYLSTESVLVERGVITQDIKYTTLVSSISRRFEIKNHNFLVRKMKDKYLLNEAGVVLSGKIRKATTERAVADMLYFNPNYHFDGEKFIDWKKVKEIQKTIGY